MFRPRTGTPLDLGSVANCCVAIILIPAPPFYARHPMYSRGGIPAHALSLFPLPTAVYPTMIIIPPGSHLSPYHHTNAHHYLYHTLLPPCLPLPYHSCRIFNAMALPPPKYLLTSHSATSELPFVATMAHSASPLPRIPYTCSKPQVSSSTAPTIPLSPVAYRFTYPVSMYLIP